MRSCTGTVGIFAFQTRPVRAVVDRDEHADVIADDEQMRIDAILDDDVDRRARKIAG